MTSREPQEVYTVSEALQADTPVTTAFGQSIWDRLPKPPNSGEGATPGAFYPATDPLNGGRLRPTIAVLDGGTFPAVDGAARHGVSAYPLIYAYVPNTDDGRARVALLDGRLRALFRRGRAYPRTDGTGMEYVVLERQPLRDADQFGYPGAVFTVWRMQVTMIRP